MSHAKLFNVNSEVSVRLTPLGLRKFQEWFAPSASLVDIPAQAKVDSEGWSQFQLWELMAIYGPHYYNGAPLMFDTTIRIDGRLQDATNSSAYVDPSTCKHGVGPSDYCVTCALDRLKSSVGAEIEKISRQSCK